MSSNIRWPKVNEAIQTVKSASPDKDSNQRYSEAMVSIDNNQLLTTLEKEAAKKYFTREKDRENLLFIKGPKYLCKTCNRDGYTLGYCEHCLRDCLKSQFANWTSGNDIIDKAIQNSQIKLPLPLQIIEWIPFEDLKDINYHTDGGYSAIYTATWTKGYIKSFDKETQKFERSTPWKCILKTLLESNSAKEKFLQEIELHISLRANAYKLVGCRGVSRNPTTGDYILVLDPMLHDLRHFTHTDNINTTWNTLCLNIVTALAQIHQEGLVHKDLHSGNILQRPDSVWVIADLGFCGPPNTLSGQLYGCIPYVAPELLFSLSSSVPLPYTSASDIYSVGMLIYEVVTGQPPFRNIYKDPKQLAIDVCSGIRPEIPAGVPEHLVVLMRRCWKADPSERPTAAELCTYFSKLSKSLANENIVIKRSNASLLDIQDFTNKSKSYQFEGLPKPKDITQDEKSKSFHLVPSHIKEKSSETKKTSLFDNKSFSEEKNGANITDSIINYNLKAPISLPLKTTSNYSKLLGPNIVTNFWKKLLLRYCCINPG